MRSIRFRHISITSRFGKCQPPTVYRRTFPALSGKFILLDFSKSVNPYKKAPLTREALLFYSKIIA